MDGCICLLVLFCQCTTLPPRVSTSIAAFELPKRVVTDHMYPIIKKTPHRMRFFFNHTKVQSRAAVKKDKHLK